MSSPEPVDGVVVVRRSGIVDAVEGAAPRRWVGQFLSAVASLDAEDADRLKSALHENHERSFSAVTRIGYRAGTRRLKLAVVVIDALPMHRSLVPLRDVILRSMDTFVAQARDGDVELRIDLAEDLPPVIQGDGEKLAWAIATLVGNSLRLTSGGKPKGGKPWVEVAATWDRRARHVEVVVRDNGPGMPPEVSRWLFDRDPRTGRAAGLALLMVRDVVFAHGGTIDVASAPDAGATFTMRLPRHHDTRAA